MALLLRTLTLIATLFATSFAYADEPPRSLSQLKAFAPQLAQTASQWAGELSANAGADAVDTGARDTFLMRADVFARYAAMTSEGLRPRGAQDLACIYIGMAQDVRLQVSRLEAATSRAEQIAALERLAGLFTDADLITTNAWDEIVATIDPVDADDLTEECPLARKDSVSL